MRFPGRGLPMGGRSRTALAARWLADGWGDVVSPDASMAVPEGGRREGGRVLPNDESAEWCVISAGALHASAEPMRVGPAA